MGERDADSNILGYTNTGISSGGPAVRRIG